MSNGEASNNVATRAPGERYWSAFAESGLSVPAFCERERNLRRQFLSLARDTADEVARQEAVQPKQTTRAVTPFVDLGALQPAGTRVEIKLDLGGGVLLHLVRG